MDSKIFALLKKQIDDDKLNAAQALVSGRAADFADYRHLCGVVRGLEMAQRNVEEMEVRVLHSDD